MAVISIGMDPVIFHLGSLSISWHALLMVVGIIAGIWLPGRLVARAGLSLDTYYTVALWAVPGGIIGARLIHVIDYWDFYTTYPSYILAFWEGGLALWGGILGGIVAAIIYARIKKLDIAPYADLIGPGLILGQAIGRIGDIINGEHLSNTTTLPWAVIYTNPDSPVFGRPPSHPAVAYELVLDLIIFGVLLKLTGKVKPSGVLFLIYLISYSTGRFLLSFLRLDSHTVQLGLNQAQWIALIVLAIAVVMLVRRLRKQPAAT